MKREYLVTIDGPDELFSDFAIACDAGSSGNLTPMGQYWNTVNLDKKEYLDSHALGVGAKLGEQVGSGHGTPDAMFILLAAMPGRRGGGDFDYDSNYYGPERTNSRDHSAGAPVVEEYNEIAKRTIGRWVGDRVVVIGDYAEDGDLPNPKKGDPPASKIYGLCLDPEDAEDGEDPATFFKNITPDVAAVIEHECHGKFTGEGWRTFERR